MALQKCCLSPQSSRNLKEMVVILIHCFYLKRKKKSGSEERSDCEGEKGISIVLMELLFSILLKLN